MLQVIMKKISNLMIIQTKLFHVIVYKKTIFTWKNHITT